MFEGIRKIINKLTTILSVDKNIIEECLSEIKKELLKADVNVKLANELIEKIRKRAYEEKIAGLTRREHLIKIIYEELSNLVGKEYEEIKITKRPFVMMFVGLFGSGKTTSVVKVARYYQKKGYSVGIIAADIYRPAAVEQLKQLASKINVPIFFEDRKNVIEIIKNGIKELSKKDIILIDTAGRHKDENSLMNEVKEIYEIIKPDEIFLVIDASIGQNAKSQAEAFYKVAPFGSIIVTKLDGTAKAGGALSACASTNAKIRFIGVGEKIEDLEIFNPKRFISRMIGLGDLETLLEKFKEVEIKKDAAEKIAEGKFDLNDFMEMVESISKVGTFDQIISMLPGIGSLKVDTKKIEEQERKMKIWKYIYQSMTPKERENPDIINESRIKRIAKGSGRKEEEVREFLNQYYQMKKLIKGLGGIKGLDRGMMKNLMKQFGL
ncbi:MAG: signal recognition particle receptor subunit alpha [Candidatus Aenigmarchaeota archaeon]|nr:signal recognition particle receptor subunit alpha [Candidatus Aenigmarchaeota archaeon]MDW8148991.1 signal recognition particle receptor subunit alpha [Candidatus Aenigmarchaeota archaeon]